MDRTRNCKYVKNKNFRSGRLFTLKPHPKFAGRSLSYICVPIYTVVFGETRELGKYTFCAPAA